MTLFFTYILYFTIYSFIGWLCETIYCYPVNNKFTNRGFLNGPFCPIYGVGALLLIMTLSGFENNYILIFIFGMILTSTLEYTTSYLMEKIFNAKWWDYSNKKFNLKGRICLGNSIIFGLMSVIFMMFIHENVEKLIKYMPSSVVIFLGFVLLIYFIIDLIITLISVMKLNVKLKQVKILSDELKSKIDLELPYEYIAEIKNKLDQLVHSHKSSHIRILRAFPGMKSIKYSETLEKLKHHVKKKV